MTEQARHRDRAGTHADDVGIGLPVISHATSIASLQAATYVSRFQSRWAAVGLRQLTAK